MEFFMILYTMEFFITINFHSEKFFLLMVSIKNNNKATLTNCQLKRPKLPITGNKV